MGRIESNIKKYIKDTECENLDGFVWLRLGISSDILLEGKRKFRFREISEICWVVKRLFASEEGLGSVYFNCVI
jgi:hypothetical protein